MNGKQAFWVTRINCHLGDAWRDILAVRINELDCFPCYVWGIGSRGSEEKPRGFIMEQVGSVWSLFAAYQGQCRVQMSLLGTFLGNVTCSYCSNNQETNCKEKGLPTLHTATCIPIGQL